MEISKLGTQSSDASSNKALEELWALRFEELKKWKDELTKDLATAHLNIEKLTDKFAKLAMELQHFIHTTNQNLEALRQKLENQTEKQRLDRLSRDVEKMHSKLNEVIEEIGAGESYDITKVPPNILELVYQSTLDDLLNELWRTLGSHDAEKFVLQTLEEVRLGTSGSELFRFDGRRIKLKDVAKSIDQKLISAKQVQMTYDELLKRLVKHTPSYKIKNFRGLIKVKSQEYTVDKIVTLIDRVRKLEGYMLSSSQIGDTNPAADVNLEALQAKIAIIENKIQDIMNSRENDKSVGKTKEVKK